MFGQNQIAPLAHINQSGETLEVHSMFFTIQGEGPHAGEPAVFIRLAGCNLRCHFCDTAFEDAKLMSVPDILKEARRLDEHHTTALVVLTGGEPMRQQIVPLIAALDEAGYHTQIETAGTVWPLDIGGITLEGAINSGAADMVCSPKTKKIHPMVEENCRHFKYIIRKGEISALDGLPVMSTQLPGHKGELFRPSDPAATIWVQPCFEYTEFRDEYRLLTCEPDPVGTQENTRECVNIAMIYGYRLSIQLHKLPGIDHLE